MALSHAQLQTAAFLAQQVYQQRPDWLAQTVDGTLFIAIEGTDEALDWRRNFEFVFTADDTHAGFANYSVLLMAQMWAAGVNLCRAEQVVVTGHSLGGAVATIIAAQLQDHHAPVHLVTFGSPRPGGAKFRDRLRIPHDRFVHGMDVVPHMPLAAFGFRHTSPAIVLPEDNDNVLKSVADHDMSIYRRLICQ
jgi:predicted alpha/beta-hydrolase family hydrolase